MDAMLADTVKKIFSDHAGNPENLWQVIEENHLTRLWVDESDDGFDLPASEGFGAMRLSGMHPSAVPYAETLIASKLLSLANIPVPAGSISFVIEGQQQTIPFGESVDHVVIISSDSIALHRVKQATSGLTIGDDPVAEIGMTFSDPIAKETLPEQLSIDSILAFAALARSAQICGALSAVLSLTIEFAGQREQFGRPLTKFQAIQHYISDMAAETAAAIAAVEGAVASISWDSPFSVGDLAIAKYRASKAVSVVADNSHQIHGAIGYTEEYQLGQFTRRLWQWRDDFGSESYWASKLGSQLLASETSLWQQVTSSN